jgi:hypothetical protein
LSKISHGGVAGLVTSAQLVAPPVAAPVVPPVEVDEEAV